MSKSSKNSFFNHLSRNSKHCLFFDRRFSKKNWWKFFSLFFEGSLGVKVLNLSFLNLIFFSPCNLYERVKGHKRPQHLWNKPAAKRRRRPVAPLVDSNAFNFWFNWSTLCNKHYYFSNQTWPFGYNLTICFISPLLVSIINK